MGSAIECRVSVLYFRAKSKECMGIKVHLSMYSGMTHRPCERRKEYSASALMQVMGKEYGWAQKSKLKYQNPDQPI